MSAIKSCPFCKEEGKKSRLICHGGSTTLMSGPLPYYDEDENYHVHDPNRVTRTYSCSNGHYFSYVFYKRCPHCDYNSEYEEKIEKLALCKTGYMASHRTKK